MPTTDANEAEDLRAELAEAEAELARATGRFHEAARELADLLMQPHCSQDVVIDATVRRDLAEKEALTLQTALDELKQRLAIEH